MQVTGKVVVVTGGANGIGRALCEAFHRAGAAKVVVADLDLANAETVAASVDGAAFKCDVGQEKDIVHVIEETERQFGRAVATKLGHPCHGPCLCRASSDPSHEGARRRLLPQHDFSGGTALAG